MDQVELVLSLCQTIYGMVENTKANKQRCQRVAQRVKGLEGLLLTIKNRRSKISPTVDEALKELSITLISAKELIAKYSGTKALKAFLKSGSHEEKFREVNEKLSDNFQVLSGALQIEHGAILHKVYESVARPEEEQSLTDSAALMFPPMPSTESSRPPPTAPMSPTMPTAPFSPTIPMSNPPAPMPLSMPVYRSPTPTPVQYIMSPRQVCVPVRQTMSPIQVYNPVTTRPLIRAVPISPTVAPVVRVALVASAAPVAFSPWTTYANGFLR